MAIDKKSEDLIRKECLKQKGYIERNLKEIMKSLNSSDPMESNHAHTIGAAAIFITAMALGEFIDGSTLIRTGSKTWKEIRDIIINNIISNIDKSIVNIKPIKEVH